MTVATLRRWGRSVALPIPKKLLSQASLEVGHEVEMKFEEGRLVIGLAKRKFTLAQLMKEHKALKLPRDKAWLDFPAARAAA